VKSFDVWLSRLGLADCKRVVIVAHDRGGAEVAANVASNLDTEIRYVTAGPARNLFDGLLPKRREVALTEGLAWAEIAIVTTGWQTQWEVSALAIAQAQGLRTAVVLDNWVNFAGRFQHHGYDVIPRELWVVDDLAARRAAAAFPSAVIHELPWSHYDTVVERIVVSRRNRVYMEGAPMRVLFVGENVGDFEGTLDEQAPFGFDQFEALLHLGRVLIERLGTGFVIRVRPHPSENPASYGPALSQIDGSVHLSSSDLIDDLSWCDVAVGLSSIALYYASRSGIPTATCFPITDSAYHQSPWEFPRIEEFMDLRT
jgi:hypothetical protein